ncbi:MAG: hypothetical protein QXJ74_08795 [Nitrososphaera sp.]
MNGTKNNDGSAEAEVGSHCPPSSLEGVALSPDWKVKQPSALPEGYELQAAIDNRPSHVELLYADHPLCGPSSEFDYYGNQLKIHVIKPEEPLDPQKYQQERLDYATNPESDIVAKVQPVDVNGYKGTGWEPYDAESIVRLNGTIIHREPFHGQAVLGFYNNDDNIEYVLFANDNQSLSDLLAIARSIK